MAMNIRRHIAYASYLLRHKWFVLRACLKTGAGLWRGIVHDASKLLPCEWYPYARTFYGPDGESRYEPSHEFDLAWLHHQHNNRHHWQWWVLRGDGGKTTAQKMPERFAREMVADWIGAGEAMGKPHTPTWYRLNKSRIMLHPETRELVERILGELFSDAEN